MVSLSVPPSQDHTISRRYDTLSVPPSQDHTISRRYDTLSVPPSQDHTISRRYDTLSVPSSQDHTISRRYVHSLSATLSTPHNQPALCTLCQCHPLKTTQSAGVTTLCQCHPLKTIQSAGVTYTLSVPSSQDHTISRRYVHSVIATLSRP